MLRIKQHIAFFSVSIAILALLLHGIIPHHHHEILSGGGENCGLHSKKSISRVCSVGVDSPVDTEHHLVHFSSLNGEKSKSGIQLVWMVILITCLSIRPILAVIRFRENRAPGIHYNYNTSSFLRGPPSCFNFQ
jgi:hypothetical protein